MASPAPIRTAGLRVPTLERELERLRTDNLHIRELAAALDTVEASYERLRRMVGKVTQSGWR